MKVFLLALLFLFSCEKKGDTLLSGVEMGMAYKIILRENISKQDLENVKKIVKETFAKVDQKLNHWNPHSEISIWNSSKSTKKIKISPFLLNAIKIADKIYSLTDGKYDPSIGKVIKLWKKALQLGYSIKEDELKKYKISTGWDKIIIFEDSIQKTHPDVEIDLDGITKGYFCDILTLKLKQMGLKKFLVEWAGEIKVCGGPFKILSGKEIILLNDKAVATSGPTFQIYPINGVVFSHFIDSKTLLCKEIEDIFLSKSIINESCAIADGLATASIFE
jgi:thiamine biosynthesis lipoprotein